MIVLYCMIEILSVAVLGSVVGLLVGIIPGMGTTFALVAGYPVLAAWSTDWMLAYYAAVTMSSQFSSSVSALMFGVLGEFTSQPALKERMELQQQGQIGIAVRHTATASIVAVIMALVVVAVLWNWLPQFVYVLRTEVKLVLLTMIVVLAWILGNNHRLINTGMIAAGFVSGMVGFSYQGQSLLTFDQWWLTGGIPVMVLLAGLIAVPGAVQFLKIKLHAEPIQHQSHPVEWSSIGRGTIIGSIIGLVPVIGNAITSQIAWLAEQRRPSSALSRVTSAESANNSGNVTVLLPLLMFGLPIVPSEMILYNMLSAQGWTNNTLTSSSVLLIFAAAAVSSVIGWIACGVLVNRLVSFVQRHYQSLAASAVVLTALSVVYLGMQAYNTVFYLAVLAVAVAVGLIFAKRDFNPFLISFLVSQPLAASVGVVVQLYF